MGRGYLTLLFGGVSVSVGVEGLRNGLAAGHGAAADAADVPGVPRLGRAGRAALAGLL